MDDITYAVSVDVNNPIIPYNVYVASVLDSNVRYLEITLYQNGNAIALSNEATATASLVTDNVLVNGSVNCTISGSIITVPLEDLQRHGNLDVQVTVIEGTKVLAIPFPIQVRVTPNIAEEAQVNENSMGSYAEVVQEIADARGDYISLSEALNHKLSSAAGAVKTANIDTGAVTEDKLATDSVATAKIKGLNVTEDKLATNSVTTSKIKDGDVTEAKLATAFKGTLYKVNTIDWEPPNYRTCEAKTIYIGVKLGDERGIIIPFYWKEKQIFIGFNGTICVRQFVGGNDYQNWGPNLSELTANKKSSITSDNQASTDFFPSIKAVVDYLTENYTNTTALNTLLNRKADYTYVDSRLNSKADTSYVASRLGSKADTSYVDSRLNTKADTSYVNSSLNTKADSSALTAKEDLSNKIITGENLYNNKNSTDKYPAAKAIVDYLMLYYANKNDQEYLQGEIADICAYLGYTSSDILGLQVDFVNSRFTRLAGAEELEAGSDFDAFPMFGGRRRCCVANDGTINAYYGERGYAEDGTNGQVMVYQPKFYYRMVPLKLEKQASGIGYHIRKANYYVTANPHPGFKLHPLFYDANGNEIDYVLLSAYEGSMYDVSASAYVNDSVDTSVSYGRGDLLCSVAGKKPISGKLSGVGNKEQFETMANNLGAGWHLNTIKAESANQLLMMIELGTMNTQPAVGLGVVSLQNNGDYNCSAYTGSTAALGNATGMATETIAESGGTETANTTNGKLSVTYRGVENPWGNIWKHTNGINLWGDDHMGGGQVFICDDFSYNESKHDGNYKPAGFSVANDGGYVSAFGYGDEDYDWLFMPSETTGNSSLPVGDNFWGTSNLNGYRIARLGGRWLSGLDAGGFYWDCYYTSSARNSYIGGRLLYVPTA